MNTTFVIIRKNPLQTFYVVLPDFRCEFLVLSLCLDQEFAAVIAHLPAFNTELNCVNIRIYHFVAFYLRHTFCLFDHHFLNDFIFFIIADVGSV